MSQYTNRGANPNCPQVTIKPNKPTDLAVKRSAIGRRQRRSAFAFFTLLFGLDCSVIPLRVHELKLEGWKRMVDPYTVLFFPPV